VLERAGLITRSRTAQLRPSRLQGAAFKDASEWLERYRPFWDESFDTLEARLRATEMHFEQRGGHLSPEEYERAGQGWSGFFDVIAERLA
jgi:hypothetical protein